MLTENVKNIIEKYIDLIDDYRFDEFFIALEDAYRPLFISSVADVLKNADIDVLSHIRFIPEGYFYNSRISECHIPTNIVTIHFKSFAFSDIESIHIPSSVVHILEEAFVECDSLQHVTIDEGLFSIGDYCFANCSYLMSINIPKSLVEFGTQVFRGCSNLTEIKYNGTQEEWNKITRSDLIMSQSSIRKIICSDGIISKI